jgi:hypothetical protein
LTCQIVNPSNCQTYKLQTRQNSEHSTKCRTYWAPFCDKHPQRGVFIEVRCPFWAQLIVAELLGQAGRNLGDQIGRRYFRLLGDSLLWFVFLGQNRTEVAQMLGLLFPW